MLKRKRLVIKHIDKVRLLSPAEKSHEQMCACYVLAFGALEFMLETLIRGWIQGRIKKHKFSYRGKSDVDTVIRALEQLAESNLKANNGIKYDSTCNLIGKLVGNKKKNDIKENVQRSPGGAPALKEAINRIETMRHNIAHGAFWPTDTSPNLDELRADFVTVYDGLIKTINDVLPRN